MRPLYTFVPQSALDTVRRHGLLSGEALVGNPEALAAAAAGRGTSVEDMRASVEKVLAGWKPHSARGVNAMFAPPPKRTPLLPNHPLRQQQLARVSIDIDRLLREVPGTRVHGQELMPYDEYVKRWTKEQLDRDEDDPSLRHRDLAADELTKLRRMSAKALWKGYADPERRGMYAPDVPHAAVITPDGRIDPKFFKVGAFYHGTTVPGIAKLEPRPSNVLGGQRAVFTTPDYDFALSMARPWRDPDFDHGSVNGQLYMREKAPGTFERLLRGPALVYEVKPDGERPRSDPRLSRKERISDTPMTVTKATEIADVLAELERRGRFALLRHGDKPLWEQRGA